MHIDEGHGLTGIDRHRCWHEPARIILDNPDFYRSGGNIACHLNGGGVLVIVAIAVTRMIVVAVIVVIIVTAMTGMIVIPLVGRAKHPRHRTSQDSARHQPAPGKTKQQLPAVGDEAIHVLFGVWMIHRECPFANTGV
jgi:hypothetical protein